MNMYRNLNYNSAYSVVNTHLTHSHSLDKAGIDVSKVNNIFVFECNHKVVAMYREDLELLMLDI